MIEIFLILFSILFLILFIFIVYYVFFKEPYENTESVNVINPFYLENFEGEIEITDSLISNKINSNFQNFGIYFTDSIEECSICLEPLNQSKIINLGCLHKFHVNCLVSWWQIQNKDTACPICRTKHFLV